MKSLNKLPSSVNDFHNIYSGGDSGEKVLGFIDTILTAFGVVPKFEPPEKQMINDEKFRIKQQRMQEEQFESSQKNEYDIAKMEANTQRSVANTYATKFGRIMGRFAPNLSLEALKKIGGQFLEKAMPYLVLFMVLVLILYSKDIFGQLPNKPRANNPLYVIKSQYYLFRNKGLSYYRLLLWRINRWWAKVTTFFKMKRVASMASGGAHVITIDREQLQNGRCDNLSWVETTHDGASGQCYNTVHPTDMTWKLDSSKTNEFYDLPQGRKNELKNYGTVKIPWDVNPEASFYVPQCEKAYYSDTCTQNGICVVADIYDDLGMECRVKTDKIPTTYPNTDPDSQGALSFDDTSIKRCVDLKTLNYVACP